MKPRGWVYVMTNASLDGLVKIGFSMKDPLLRASEGFDPAGLPDNYDVRYMAFVEEPRSIEQLCHSILAEHHYKKEWFRVSVAQAVDGILGAAEKRQQVIFFQHNGPDNQPVHQHSSALPVARQPSGTQSVLSKNTAPFKLLKNHFAWDKSHKAWVLKAQGELLNGRWVLRVQERINLAESERSWHLQSVDELREYCRTKGFELESFWPNQMNPVLGKSCVSNRSK